MTDQQKSEQAWMEYSKKFGRSVHPKSSSQRTLIDFKSSLKRDIEKRIGDLERHLEYDPQLSQILISQINECKRFLELIETVEP